MNLIERIKNICLYPIAEWLVIAIETTPPKAVVLRYILPLVVLDEVTSIIGSTLNGHNQHFLDTFRSPFTDSLSTACFNVVMAITNTFILAFIVNVLSTSFGGEKNSHQAFKLVTYSYTPIWVSGLFLNILPSQGVESVLGGVAAFYGFYLFELGSPLLMKRSVERSLSYTFTVSVCALVLPFWINISVATVVGSSMFMGAIPHISKSQVLGFFSSVPTDKIPND